MFDNDSKEIFLFYGWWQFWVCLFAFTALLAIWWHIGRNRKDHGQVWLALSVLCWSLSGLVEVLFVSQVVNQQFIEVSRSTLSLSNSLFILLSLPWFRYLPGKLEAIIKSNHWHLIIGILFLFCLLPTLSRFITAGTSALTQELDVYYAFFTLTFLGAVLWTTFQKRRLASLAYLSLVCIAITFLTQIFKLTGATINVTLFSAIFKTSLIMLFFALALSWVKELTENIIPNFKQLHLEFRKKERGSTDRNLIVLSGIPKVGLEPIQLSPANYNLIKKFALRRKNNEEGWLEIKPKEIIKKEFDIKDHNEIKRFISAFLDGLFGSGSWTKEQHFVPLKEALLELSDKRERKIRLRLQPKQITIETL